MSPGRMCLHGTCRQSKLCPPPKGSQENTTDPKHRKERGSDSLPGMLPLLVETLSKRVDVTHHSFYQL